MTQVLAQLSDEQVSGLIFAAVTLSFVAGYFFNTWLWRDAGDHGFPTVSHVCGACFGDGFARWPCGSRCYDLDCSACKGKGKVR